MAELIIIIALLAAVGSLGVPIIVFALARVGYFPPVEIRLLGRVWQFERVNSFIPVPAAMGLQSNSAIADNSRKVSANGTIIAVVCLPVLVPTR